MRMARMSHSQSRARSASGSPGLGSLEGSGTHVVAGTPVLPRAGLALRSYSQNTECEGMCRRCSVPVEWEMQMERAMGEATTRAGARGGRETIPRRLHSS